MNNRLGLKITALVLLGAFAVVACVGVSTGALTGCSFFPAPTETTAATETEATTEPVTEPTEETQALTESFELPPITWATYPPERELTATRAFVYDCQSESYIYLLGDPEEQLYPASITKLFSVHVAMQYLGMEEKLIAGTILDRIPEDASTADLKEGDLMTVETLLQGMIMPSGNDAAYLIATQTGREIAGDPDLGIDEAIAVFVEEMNRQALALGLTGTHFENPDGYHSDGHYTNFNDLVEIAKLSLKNEKLMEFARLPKATVLPVLGEKKEWINTNLLVNPETDYYCPYAIGLKTGQTQAAGSCLLSAFDIEGHQYIIGVFGSPKFNDKLDDTLQLFNEIVMEQ